MKSPRLKSVGHSSAVPFLAHVASKRLRRNARGAGKGALAGIFAGLIGTIVMTGFQEAWSKASNAFKQGSEKQSGAENQPQEKEDATMKAAGKIGEFIGRPLTHEQKKVFGPIVHYSFGTAQGAVYGVVTELAGTGGSLVNGVIFGAALFAIADELAVPALGLSGKASEAPLSSHLYSFASHLVYGVTTEIARRGLRGAL